MAVKAEVMEPNDQKVYPKQRTYAENEKRAADFQKGHNSMEMTPFEKNMVLGEREERQFAKDKYILGLQGVDGGYCYERKV